MSDMRLKRPKECIDDCSQEGHEFGPGGDGEIITGAYGWALYQRDAPEDDSTPDPKAEVVEATYQKDAWDDFPPSFLCRCCQHELTDADAKPEEAPKTEVPG